MNKLKIFVVALIFVSILNIHPSLASNYPQPVGYVNDYAGILSLNDVQRLEAELKAFDNQTTDEVVVVTVNSLEGLSARAYTIGLANNWKVGKKFKNNGVLFLVAPNEREVDIEVGSGLDQILTQSGVNNILDDDVVPFLKDNQWSEGIFSGAHSIMNKLNGQTVQTPLQSQPANPSEPLKSQTANPEDIKTFLMVVGFIVGVIFVAIIGFWARGKYLLKKENQQSLLKCQEKISALEAVYPISNQTLEILMHNNPQSVWQNLKMDFKKIVVNDIWQEFFDIQDKAKKGWKMFEEIKKDIEELDKKVVVYSDICEKIKNLPDEIEKAKTESINLISSLPETILATQKAVGQVDVFDETKLSFENTEKKFQVLTEQSKLDKVDWLELHTELNKLSSNLNQIQANAESNRMTAAKARSEGPKLMEKLPELMDKLERKIDSDDAKRILAEAKVKYQEANSIHNQSTDWLQTYFALVAVNNLIDDAERTHHHHVESERRRRESSSSSWESHSSYSPGGGGGFGNVGGSRKF